MWQQALALNDTEQGQRLMRSAHLIHSVHERLVLRSGLERQVGVRRALHIRTHNVHAVAVGGQAGRGSNMTPR